MIIPCNDTRNLASVWLEVSLSAHAFVPAETWISARESMEREYLPASDNYAFTDELGGKVKGFISLRDNRIEALFVAPECQGLGIGSTLLAYACGLRGELTLSVYEKNIRAVKFYTDRGFLVTGSGTDPFTGERELVLRYSPADVE